MDRVLSAIEEANLIVNPNKCEWDGKTMLHLGYVLGMCPQQRPCRHPVACSGRRKWRPPSTVTV